MRQLLGGQLPGGLAAEPAKPAIGADQGAPRNGGPVSGSAAPTMVSSAPPAAHQTTQATQATQATQVSPAPTQVVQASMTQPTQVQAARPAPAPAQAGAKQGANGKEDDEDWWTE